jgi:hypothetical protein
LAYLHHFVDGAANDFLLAGGRVEALEDASQHAKAATAAASPPAPTIIAVPTAGAKTPAAASAATHYSEQSPQT